MKLNLECKRIGKSIFINTSHMAFEKLLITFKNTFFRIEGLEILARISEVIELKN